MDTYLFLLLVKVIDDDTNEEVEGEERAEYNKDDKIDVHVDVVLILRLVSHLRREIYFKQVLWFRLQLRVLKNLTFRESTAAYMMSIHPLKVALEVESES